MKNIPVTTVTKDATHDLIPDEMYLSGLRDLLANGTPERAGPWTYRQLIEAVDSQYSPAWWNLRNREQRALTREGKSELRLALDDLPPLPASVTAVTEQMIHPDAEMLLIGLLPEGERVRRVLMIADSAEMQIHVNGTVQAWPVTPVTEPESAGMVEPDPTPEQDGNGAGERCYARNKRYYRPCLPVSLKERMEAAGLNIEEVLEEKLASVEN
ncbi:hypothetical protein GC175_17125 [bacterium]|nr:hypothetical protein [bacterium]